MKIAQNITQLIGNTPIIKLQNASKKSGATVLAKCEFMNPTGSVKDRIGYFLIEEALKRGDITKETTIIEPTSGNTGIALASACAAFGMKLILTMPESMSMERRKLLGAFGAKLVLTPAKDGMGGAIVKANELKDEMGDAVVLGQFSNSDNPKAHTLSTALEILEDTDGKIDVFVSAVGTGGTLSGIGRVLKDRVEGIVIIAVEPASSAVLSGEMACAHAIQGIGAGFVPQNLDTTIYGEVIKVKNEDAILTAKSLAMEEGLLVGISSGANVWAATQIASRDEYRDKTVLTILCDTGERYISTELFQ
jgi:cysteine synthase A